MITKPVVRGLCNSCLHAVTGWPKLTGVLPASIRPRWPGVVLMELENHMKFGLSLFAVLILATPALAFETEEIGVLEARFGDENISQPTVIARSENETSATAFLFLAGGGFSSFSIAGYSLDNKRLSLELDYMSERPAVGTVPIGVTITYAPQGTAQHWTSEGAPTPPAISFTRLDVVGEEGHAVGTFAALLCYADGYGVEADTANCRQIDGHFDTRFFVEQ